MGGGGAVSSGAGAGRANESGGASEVWHLALSSSPRPADKNPRASNAAFFVLCMGCFRDFLSGPAV
jgi:hypothetical protein